MKSRSWVFYCLGIWLADRQVRAFSIPTVQRAASATTLSQLGYTSTEQDAWVTQKRRRRSPDSPPPSSGLTKEEELNYSFAIRRLRTVLRIRDQLELQSTSPGPTSTHRTVEGPSQAEVSNLEWARACGLQSESELRKVLKQGQQARTKLVNANVGLVTSIAKRHSSSLKRACRVGQGSIGTILNLEDMMQEGFEGLLDAAERFEPERGFRFSTYATWWIRQRILRSISDSSRTIRLPAHVHSMLIKIHKARQEITKELGGRAPTDLELAHYLEMPVKKLMQYTATSLNVVSLESPIQNSSPKGDDRRTLGDGIASDEHTPEEDAQIQFLKRDIRAVVNELGERERNVLIARFGLDDGKPQTVQETARLLGMTRDRVRTMEARALNQLRRPQQKFRLKEYVGDNGETHRSSTRRNTIRSEETQTETILPKAQPSTQSAPEKIWFF